MIDGAARSRHRITLAAMIIATIVLGLAWRFAIPGLPWFLWKYGGSLLWAGLIYLLLAFCLPQTQGGRLLLIGAAIVTALEFSRLYHAPWLDEFRQSMPGRITLGNVFSLWNIPAYYAGLIAAFLLDEWMLKKIKV